MLQIAGGSLAGVEDGGAGGEGGGRGGGGGGQEHVAYVGGCRRGGWRDGSIDVRVCVCWGCCSSQPPLPASKYYACKEE